ncbi:MAG TPA: lactate racemase domain-containing protein, partial [Limnochordales bacterium]
MKVEMPYGPRDRIPVEVPDSMLAGVLKPAELTPASDPLDVVRRALRQPTGRGRLRDDPRVRWAARLGDGVAIVISDASRPPVERWVVPALLEELREAGVDERQVTVFVGTGSHRPATPDEIAEKLGSELARRLRVVNHEIDRSPMRFLGFSRHGHPIVVNREVADSACKIVVGTVLPHPICGYSGHAKGAVIGVGGAPTIASTHTPAMLDDPRVGLGLLDGNPFYETIVDGGRMLGIDFIVNVVCTPDGAIVDSEAGDMVAAHRALVERTARPAFEATFSERADIVLVSAGHPKDHNLYHIAAEALAVVAGEAAPTPCVKDEGGTIIVVSPIEEGAYSTGFYQRMVQGG